MTTVLAIAVAAGVAAGVAGGGRLRSLLRARLRAGWLLVAGAALQAAVLGGAVPVHGTAALGCILGSYAALAAFAVGNMGRPGMGVLLVGVVLNMVPIAVDGGMPFESGAIVRARIAAPADVRLLSFGTKRHLATSADRLRVLDDRFPDWPSRVVLSIGDLVIAVGTAAVVAGLLRRVGVAGPPPGPDPVPIGARPGPVSPPPAGRPSAGATGRPATG
jgi:uncharacterized protein DUF5317